MVEPIINAPYQISKIPFLESYSSMIIHLQFALLKNFFQRFWFLEGGGLGPR